MDLKGKTIFITGATDGIGKETAYEAASMGAKVIVHGRDEQRIKKTIEDIKQKTGNPQLFKAFADFSSLAAVKSMLDELKADFSEIDILFNNAAEFTHNRELTEDGFERQFQVNYLAHFLITENLLPLIKDVEASRILNVSSMIHSPAIDFDNLQGEKEYSGSGAYALTKLLNILHANDLSDRLKENKVIVHSLHPGVIETKLLNAAWSGGAPVSEGAANLIYTATTEAVENMSGLYIENRRPMQSNPISYDKEIQKKLRNISFELLKDYLN